MDLTDLVAFSMFALIAGVTPGPNNVMLAASGANFGFRRTLPHIVGVLVGFLMLVIMGSLGLTQLFLTFPNILNIARVIFLGFLLYMIWRIATAQPPDAIKTPAMAGRTTKPLGFIAAMLFQLINPKAMLVISSAVTVYIGEAENLYVAISLAVSVFACVTILSTTLWTYTGIMLRGWLKNKRHLRIFNFTMAGLLGVSVLPVIIKL